MLLGEYIDAIHLEYDDCKMFQIVCPECYEPIFKVQRDNEREAIEYLSHYKESKLMKSNCELRINNISKSFQASHNSESRNQRIALFLSVLRELIGSHPMYANDFRKTHSRLIKSKPLKLIRDLIYAVIVKNKISQEEFYRFAADYVEDVFEMGGMIKTAFSISLQKRIAFDIWKHLLSPLGKTNFNFIFNHSYLMLLTRMTQASEVRTLSREEIILTNSLAGLIRANKNRGKEIISELMEIEVGPPFAEEGSNLFVKISAEIMHEITGTLISLNYFDSLKSSRIKPSPH